MKNTFPGDDSLSHQLIQRLQIRRKKAFVERENFRGKRPTAVIVK